MSRLEILEKIYQCAKDLPYPDDTAPGVWSEKFRLLRAAVAELEESNA